MLVIVSLEIMNSQPPSVLNSTVKRCDKECKKFNCSINDQQ